MREISGLEKDMLVALHEKWKAAESDRDYWKQQAADRAMETIKAESELASDKGLLARLFLKAISGDIKRIDHACEKCPGALMRGQGFLCAYHEAEIRLTEIGAFPVPSPEAKP